MQVKEGIHRLTQGVVNFYLIEEVRKLLLVDADAPATGTCWSGPWPTSAAGWTTWRRCCSPTPTPTTSGPPNALAPPPMRGSQLP